MTDREFLERTYEELSQSINKCITGKIDEKQFCVNALIIRRNIWKHLHNFTNEVEKMNEEIKAKKPEVTEEEVRAVFNDLKDAVKMAKEYFSGSDSAPTKEEVLARVGNIKSRLTEMVEKLEEKETEEEPKNQRLTVYVKGCFEEFTFEPDEYTEYYYDGKFFHIMNDFQTVGMFALSEIIYVVVGDKL